MRPAGRTGCSATPAVTATRCSPPWRWPSFYLGEAERTNLLGLRDAASGRVVVGVVEPDLASHEPRLVPGNVVLRTWYPVIGAPQACVQLRFPEDA